MMRFLISLLALTALPVQAAAQTGSFTADPPWPREVRKIYDDMKAECKAGGGKFVPDRKRFASETEVTNDGKSDWVVEYDAARCTTSGSSAHCGTAGCSIVILGSGRNGLTSIFDDNVRGWEVVEVAPRRKGLLMEVHGTACGGFGAELCRQTIAWNGRKWDLINSKRGMTDAEKRAQEAEAAAYVQPPGHVAKWIAVGKGKDAVAAVTGHPSFAAIGLRCNPNGGLFMSVVPAADYKLPPAGRDLMLSFTGSVVELEWTQSLRPEAGKRDYSEALPDVLRNMLAGRDDSLGLLASTDGGDEWQELEFLSLAGSSAAIRTLETQCAGVAGAIKSSPAGAEAVGQGKVDFPPLPKGFYAYNATCAEAVANDDPMDGIAYFDKNSLSQWDGGPEISGFEALGNGRYLVRARSWGNGGEENDPGVEDNFVIRITDPSSFVTERTQDRYRHCPTNTVPKNIRESFAD